MRPSAVTARSPKISRIRPVRSITLVPISSSRFFCWIGAKGASTTTSPALSFSTSAATSSTCPLPIKVAGRTVRRRTERSPTTRTPIASARPFASSRRASDDRRDPSRGISGTTMTARSPRATSIAPLPSKLFRVVLRIVPQLRRIEVERLIRLQGRDRVLIDQLDLATTFEQNRELVESGDRPLQHDAIDQEQGHSLLLACRGRQEQVLQRRAAALPDIRRNPGDEVSRRFGRHNRRDRMFVDQLRSAIAPQQQGERIEPG